MNNAERDGELIHEGRQGVEADVGIEVSSERDYLKGPRFNLRSNGDRSKSVRGRTQCGHLDMQASKTT